MKWLLFGVLGFAAGLMGALAFRAPASAPVAIAKATPPANELTVRRWEAPAAFRSELETRLAAARRGEGGSEAVRDLQQAVDRWFLGDPLACIAWLQDHGAIGLARPELLDAVFAGAFRGDLGLALREARHLTDARLHYAWVDTIFAEASQSSPAQAFELLDALPKREWQPMGSLIADRWAARDLRTAWQAVMKDQRHRRDARSFVDGMLAAAAAAHPDETRAFIAEKMAALTDDRESMLFRSALRSFALSEHNELALSALAGRPRDRDFEGSWTLALEHATSPSGLEKTLQLVAKEPAGYRRENALALVAMGLAPTDPRRALQLVEGIADPEQYWSVEKRAVHKLVEQNPADAAAFVEAHSDLFLRGKAMGEVSAAWLKRDPNAMLAFALKAPAPERGVDWLDTLAPTIAAYPTSTEYLESPWHQKVDPVLWEKVLPELRTRLGDEAYARVEKMLRRDGKQ
jgi:hypothetical protein